MEAAEITGALRIECGVLASWVGSLVLRMLALYVAARERSQQVGVTAARADAGSAHGCRR
jgi:hypothetical protein